MILSVEFRVGAAGRLDSLCTEVPVLKVADLSAELAGCQFGDVRLTKRARKLADALSQKPNISIPAALQSRADIEACYRFFNNEKVTPEKILQPHIERTYQRISQIDFVLLVQDTTELDLTRPEQQVEGAGPMDSESRRGLFYHPMIAFDVAGVALGIVGEKSWTREEVNKASQSREEQETKADSDRREGKLSLDRRPSVCRADRGGLLGDHLRVRRR